jgi:hypothetical protein
VWNFLCHVAQFPVPALKPGDLVIMDNRRSHKSATIQTAIRTAGARLIFLLPYGPDLNPIAQAFAKFNSSSEEPASAPSKPHGKASDPSSQPSSPMRVQTLSRMRDMQPSRFKTLTLIQTNPIPLWSWGSRLFSS